MVHGGSWWFMILHHVFHHFVSCQGWTIAWQKLENAFKQTIVQDVWKDLWVNCLKQLQVTNGMWPAISGPAMQDLIHSALKDGFGCKSHCNSHETKVRCHVLYTTDINWQHLWEAGTISYYIYVWYSAPIFALKIPPCSKSALRTPSRPHASLMPSRHGLAVAWTHHNLPSQSNQKCLKKILEGRSKRPGWWLTLGFCGWQCRELWLKWCTLKCKAHCIEFQP